MKRTSCTCRTFNDALILCVILYKMSLCYYDIYYNNITIRRKGVTTIMFLHIQCVSGCITIPLRFFYIICIPHTFNNYTVLCRIPFLIIVHTCRCNKTITYKQKYYYNSNVNTRKCSHDVL
jgi:hypothetical protein